MECRDNATGETLLHKASAKGFDLLCKLLVQWGASPNALDDANELPADAAQLHGHHDLACRLKWTTSILMLSAGRKRALEDQKRDVIVID